MVPNLLPWVHTASARSPTSSLDLVGGGVRREVDVGLRARLATAGPPGDDVADGSSDEVQPLAGGLEALRDRRRRLEHRAGAARGTRPAKSAPRSSRAAPPGGSGRPWRRPRGRHRLSRPERRARGGSPRRPGRATQAPTHTDKRLEVIAAFEEGDEAPGRHEAHGLGRQVGEVARAQAEIGQRVRPMGVETGRDREPVRGELLRQRA